MGVDETSDTPMEVNNTQASGVERKGRGAVQCKRITKMREGEVLNVQYNEDGQRIGEGGKDLASYSGLLAESRISIVDYKNWHEVGEEARDLLWDAIKAKFNLTEDTKKVVLSDIGDKWKEFKSRLTRNYITPYKDQPEKLLKPPKKHKKNIRQEDWERFVKSRLTPEFQKISKLNSQRRGAKVYNHRTGKTGFADIGEQLKKELGSAFDGKNRRPSIWKRAYSKKGKYIEVATERVAEKIDVLTKEVEEGKVVIEGSKDILTLALGTPEHPGRTRAVGKGITPTTYFHVNKRGSKEHVRKLESTIQEQRDKNDRLQEDVSLLLDRVRRLEDKDNSLPIEKISSNNNTSVNIEHTVHSSGKHQSGRLVKKFQQLKKNEKATQPPSKSKADHGNKENKKTQGQTPFLRPTSGLGQGLECNLAQSDRVNKANKKTQSQTSFSGPTSVLGEGLKYNLAQLDRVNKPNKKTRGQKFGLGEEKECYLATVGRSNIVAEGLVYEGNKRKEIHGYPLGLNNVRVAVVSLVSEEAGHFALPIQVNEELRYVADALGTQVPWPKDHVYYKDDIEVDDDIEVNDIEESKNKTSDGHNQDAIDSFMGFLNMALPGDQGSIHFPIGGELFGDNMGSFIMEKSDIIDVCNMRWLDAAILVVYMRILYDEFMSYRDVVGFVNPLSFTRANGHEKTQIIMESLQNTSGKRVVLIPYNPGGHWVLIVINLSLMTFTWLDSMHNLPSNDMDIYFNSAIMTIERLEGNGRKGPVKWERIMGPYQPGNKECGYYVMKFMREIMEACSDNSFENKMTNLSLKDAYTQEELDIVRLEILRFIQQNGTFESSVVS